jgi:hypothetical protein
MLEAVPGNTLSFSNTLSFDGYSAVPPVCANLR